MEELMIDYDEIIQNWFDENKIKQQIRTFFEYYFGSSSNVGYDAYMKAYPSCNIIDSAYTNSSRLLRNAKYQPVIKLYRERQKQEINFNKDNMIATMVKMWETDITEIMEILYSREAVINPETNKPEVHPETGEAIWIITKEIFIKRLNELPKFMRMAVAEVKQTRDGMQVKMTEKNKLAELIGKYTDSFTPDTNVNVQAQVVFQEDITEADLE